MNFLSISLSDKVLESPCIIKFCQGYLAEKDTNKKLVMTLPPPVTTPRYTLFSSTRPQPHPQGKQDFHRRLWLLVSFLPLLDQVFLVFRILLTSP